MKPNYASSRTVRIEHIDLRLDIYPVEERFDGEARLQITALAGFQGEVRLDFDEIDIESVTDGEGVALDWSHDEGALVVSAETCPAALVVRWHCDKPTAGMYFTHPTEFEPDRAHTAWTQCQDEDGHLVFPCHDHPRFKYTWDITLTGPVGTTLLSNGAEVEQGERDGRAYAHFVQDKPMPPYLFTAVCAPLSVHVAEWRGRPVRYFVPVGREEHIVRSMGKTPLMIEEFSRITGIDYPWPRYDQVVVDDFIFGGMENTACTVMTDVLLVDEKASVEWEPDGLVSHELAHQWFGDLVTCQDWSQGWLNESWATFMETVWMDADRDEGEATWYRFEQARGYFAEDSGRYRRPIVSYEFRDPIDVFDRHLYNKGACVLNTLRAKLGAEAFWGGVNTYVKRHGHNTAHTRHFQRAMEDATGYNLDRFFAEWIHGAGHPEVQIKLGKQKGLLTVAVRQKQSGKQTAEAFEIPLRLEVVEAGGATRTIDLPVEERDRTWAIPYTQKIKTVRVDPGFRFLGEVEIEAPRGWLVTLLDDACPVLATRAAAALLDEGSQQAFRAVVAAMGAHPLRFVREELAGKLATHGGSRVRDALLAALGTEKDPRVRRALCTALGKFRESVVADALIGVLDAEPETWHLVSAALVALGRTRDPRAIEVITPYLDVDSWAEHVRTRAFYGLAFTEHIDVVDTLVPYTRAGRPERLRAMSADALARLGDKVEAARDPIMERLVEMMGEPGVRSQLSAIGALGTLKHPGSAAALARVHRAGIDGRGRRNAYEALSAVRAGRTSEQGLASLRRQIEEVSKENHDLRQRLRKLESRVDK